MSKSNTGRFFFGAAILAGLFFGGAIAGCGLKAAVAPDSQVAGFIGPATLPMALLLFMAGWKALAWFLGLMGFPKDGAEGEVSAGWRRDRRAAAWSVPLPLLVGLLGGAITAGLSDKATLGVAAPLYGLAGLLLGIALYLLVRKGALRSKDTE